MSELRKSRDSYKGANTFALTAGEPDEELEEPPNSADPYKTLGLSASKHQKSINRFETPAQVHKNETSRERSEPKK